MINFPINELIAEDAMLVSAAREATELSYAPYSNFHVGAAVLLANGKVVKGGNQENSSYPCGICAERSALATAQNVYPGIPIVAIGLAGRKNDVYSDQIITPCGMCRQVMAEVEKRYQSDIRIIMSSRDNVMIVNSVKEILPLAFL